MRPAFQRKLETLRRPAVHLVPAQAETGSWLGGLPQASPALAWPTHGDIPMSFMAQIRLSDLPRPDDALLLPPHGYLYFFYDLENIEAGRVIWQPSESDLTEIPAPPPPEPPPAKGLKKLLGIKPKAPKFELYRKLPVAFQTIQTYPPADSELLKPFDGPSDEDFDTLCELRDAVYGGLPAHHLFGYPDPEQHSEMEVECEVESTGSPLNLSQAFSNPATLRAAKDWRLLLQLDEDGATGFEFVDAGKLYFWIRTQDAANRDFSRVQAICQFG